MLESDARFRGLYIMLDRVDVHCIWVSPAVLALLPPDLPDIPGGDIVRDPPGMGVFCDNAMEYVMTFWPKPGTERRTAFLRSAMQSLHAVGLVGMHDAGVNPDELRLYRELARAEDWTLRVYAMIECRERNTFCPGEVASYVDDRGFLSIKSVKLFAGQSPADFLPLSCSLCVFPPYLHRLLQLPCHFQLSHHIPFHLSDISQTAPLAPGDPP